MPVEEPITLWISELKAGNHAAAEQLWNRYFAKMVQLARNELKGFRRRAVDEEDVALTAFDSFCRCAENGRFSLLSDRNNLWPLLVVITARKAVDAIKHENAIGRGGGAVQGESAFLLACDGPDQDRGIEAVIGAEPTPAFVAELADQTRHWLEKLPKEKLRTTMLLKMDGHTNLEITEKMGCTERSVERRLKIIRTLLEKEVQP